MGRENIIWLDFTQNRALLKLELSLLRLWSKYSRDYIVFIT